MKFELVHEIENEELALFSTQGSEALLAKNATFFAKMSEKILTKDFLSKNRRIKTPRLQTDVVNKAKGPRLDKCNPPISSEYSFIQIIKDISEFALENFEKIESR